MCRCVVPGCRYVEISLDERVVFKGEIKRAPGATEDLVRAGDAIFPSPFAQGVMRCTLWRVSLLS